MFEEFNGTQPEDFLGKLQAAGPHTPFIDSITERLSFSVALLHEKTGSSEISQSLVGLNLDETGFGELYNRDNKILEISNLAPGEIYIGSAMAELIFLDDDPIGENLTVATSVTSIPFPPLLNETRTIDISLN
ncbi:MAG: hypothetical protein ACXAC2_25500, partial [Candidatus Kariarchaeaceae archaeon]